MRSTWFLSLAILLAVTVSGSVIFSIFLKEDTPSFDPSSFKKNYYNENLNPLSLNFNVENYEASLEISEKNHNPFSSLQLTNDEVLKIFATLQYYESALTGQPSDLVVSYANRYAELNFQNEKIEMAKNAIVNIVEYKISLAQIELNTKPSAESTTGEIQNTNTLKKNLFDRLLAREGASVYAPMLKEF